MQSGVALVVVMVMLLLMSLTSATAIQQNKLQFSMVGNLQEQTQAFTHSENILVLAEQSIDELRWSDARTGNEAGNNDDFRCKANGNNYQLIAPGTVLNLGIPGSVATVTGWWCQNNPATQQPATCVIGETCPVISKLGIDIYGNVFPGTALTPELDETGCGTELYTIQVQFTQQNVSGAVRTVESDYSVKCLRTEQP